MQRGKHIYKAFAIFLGVCFAAFKVIAALKNKDSVYENEPDQKNPLEGKTVRFVYNENDPENADGVRGHLEATGEAQVRSSFYQDYVKKGLDKGLSFAGLLVLSPGLAAIAIAIKIDDPGPILFTQKRVGKNKQYFRLHNVFKIDGDVDFCNKVPKMAA